MAYEIAPFHPKDGQSFWATGFSLMTPQNVIMTSVNGYNSVVAELIESEVRPLSPEKIKELESIYRIDKGGYFTQLFNIDPDFFFDLEDQIYALPDRPDIRSESHWDDIPKENQFNIFRMLSKYDLIELAKTDSILHDHITEYLKLFSCRFCKTISDSDTCKSCTDRINVGRCERRFHDHRSTCTRPIQFMCRYEDRSYSKNFYSGNWQYRSDGGVSSEMHFYCNMHSKLRGIGSSVPLS